MMLKTRVKVGNISNLSDARYCAGMGVDMHGCAVIPGQEGYVPEALYQDMRGWFSGPATAAELYVITPDLDLNKVLEGYLPDFVEVVASDMHLLDSLKDPDINVADRSVQDIDTLRNAQQRISYDIVGHENIDLMMKLRPDYDV